MTDQPLRAAILPVTPLQQNCSLIWCTKTMRGAFVDPGGDLPKLRDAVERAGVTIEKILITHGHIDHCGSAGIFARELGVKFGVSGGYQDSASRSRARTKKTASGSPVSPRTAATMA